MASEDTPAGAMELRDFYAAKSPAYFSGVRTDILEELPKDPAARILEIGCGTGGTGEAALATGRAGFYRGVEFDPGSAERARSVLSDVVCANVETIDPALIADSYDVLILSEVLEHLIDPWGVMKALAPFVKPGGRIYASSPNISHHRVIRSLVAGRFDYVLEGVMDRTHVRWFTPASYRQMFEDAGFRTVSVGPLRPYDGKARLINRLSGGRLAHLFQVQIMYKGRKPGPGRPGGE
ncbi:MAG TPA: class I SAM-dependent methyltransferase [Allosphingosinicella sp.]|nr:class I SAM-dependent methyltransferase [Allosphingosinicella sp.]